MSWPIPTLIKKDPISPPNLWFWTIFLILLQITALIIGIFILNYESPKKIVGLCLIPAILGWLIIYIFWIIKYIGSSLLIKYWNKEIQKTDTLWKQWGGNKIAVLGNVILSPENDGIDKLLKGEPPIFPQKGRPLYLHGTPLDEILQNIHQQLNSQYPEYNKYIEDYFLLLPESLSEKQENYQNIIKQKWNNKRIHIFHNIKDILSLFNNDIERHQTILLLTLQLWSDNQENYSEFITAQILSSTSCIEEQNNQKIYGHIGRSMDLPLYNIETDFHQFITYGCDDHKKIQSVWTNNIDENLNANIIIELGKQQISASIKKINYSFGPIGPFSLIFSIATAIEARKKQQTEQLVFNQLQNNIVLYRIS